MSYTEWDKFKDTKIICNQLGCKQKDKDVCCPELMGILCSPKRELVNRLKISENDMDDNKITLEDVIRGEKK